MLRRLEARHGSPGRNVLRVLLLLGDFVDQKSVAAGREDVPVLRVLIGRSLHERKLLSLELTDLRAGRQRDW